MINETETPQFSSRPHAATLLYSAGANLAAACLAALLFLQLRPASAAAAEPPDSVKSAYVGSGACRSCHQDIYTQWKQSQHALAMQEATQETVLGDFDDAELDHYGVKSRFFRKNGQFFVETDGPHGSIEEFEIKYTFGLKPLQQYLIEFPDGRIQALSIAWDARPKEQGGQRWFHLYPNEKIDHTDSLHWTGLQQNWNFMCGECHTTDFQKNYDPATDRYATTWSEMDVGCESCHGAGSSHIAWAEDNKDWWRVWRKDDPHKGFGVGLDERKGVTWTIDPETGNAERSKKPGNSRVEVELCGRCHARRSTLSEAWEPGKPLSDTHLVALLEAGLFEDDGQMRDEVYNYHSFRQSKMYAAGVTCSDCHNPHTAELKADGADVCLQCHDAKAYASADHHFHGNVEDVTCVSCHMPQRAFMVVDPRHDHSFRVPRPDLSVTLDTPNACTDCHQDKTAEWAAEAIARVHGKGRKGFQKYAHAFHAARNGTPDAAALLFEVTRDAQAPAVARATAYAELGSMLSPAMRDQFRRGLADPDPVVRIGALRGLDALPAQARWPLANALLTDPVRSVRIDAASFLAPVPKDNLSAEDKKKFEAAATEYIAAQRLNADRPESRTNLGNFFAAQGRAEEAEAEYQAALRLEPRYLQAAVNLADVYRMQGRDKDAETTLRKAMAEAPNDAAVKHALALTLVRQKREEEALALLREATELAPAQARYAYVYAIALNSAGQTGEALKVLEENAERNPRDMQTLAALISINREQGDATAALQYAEQLYELNPQMPGLSQTLQALRATIGSTAPDLTKP